ncbi:ASA1_1 [Sanghuangporus weigelae]
MHAPSPSHILRIHAAHVTAVSFSMDNERLYSGDTSGNVVVTSTRTLRPIASWRAHTDGVLGVQEWAMNIVTHGRDNKLHVWERVLAPPSLGTVASNPDMPTPQLRYSLDVNALNFCRLSLLPYSAPQAGSSSSSDASESALVAVPNLIESSLADIWELPSCSRLHAAIGKPEAPEIGMKSWQIDSDGRDNAKTGILMSLHLFMKSEKLHLLSAYESGEVALRQCIAEIAEKTIEGRGWECLWKSKQHNESVMAMAVSCDSSFALTVSADPTITRCRLDGPHENRLTKHRIKQTGNGSVALRSDGRVCAVGGWDGKIRLFSTKTFKPLGTLSYHTKSCQALAFAHSSALSSVPDTNVSHESEDENNDDDLTQEEKEARTRWLASGSQDHRIAVWQLISFLKDAH